jgi:hypothetical protein
MISVVSFLGFALASGLAAGGIVATAAQMLTGQAPCFEPPFVRPSRIVRSLAVTALLGPYMLFNEALAAWEEQRIPPIVVATSGALSLGWALASGVVLVFLAGQVVSFL